MIVEKRIDIFKMLPTPRYKLKAFEKRIYDLKKCSFYEFLYFLLQENVKIMYKSVFIGALALLAEISSTNTSNNMSLIGESLDCDFQFWKRARRSKNTSPFLQKFHCRVYLLTDQIIVLSETETDPLNLVTGLVHLSENHEHRLIRLKHKK